MRAHVTALFALAVLTSGCEDKKSSSVDAGAKALPVASARTTRLDCGGSFGACPPGEYCYYDKPGCESTGYCGPAEPSCVHSTAFCGCMGVELACTHPKRTWIEQGKQCFGREPAGSASAAASSSPSDAGPKTR